MLEELLKELIAAVKANTAALGGKPSTTSSSSSSSSKTTTNNKPPASKGGKAKHTVEEACALVIKINDEHGKDVAREVLSECGFAKLKDVTAEGADKLFKAATEKLEELDGGAEEEEAEDL